MWALCACGEWRVAAIRWRKPFANRILRSVSDLPTGHAKWRVRADTACRAKREVCIKRSRKSEPPVGPNLGQRENTREMGHRLRKQRSEFPVGRNSAQREKQGKMTYRPRNASLPQHLAAIPARAQSRLPSAG